MPSLENLDDFYERRRSIYKQKQSFIVRGFTFFCCDLEKEDEDVGGGCQCRSEDAT